MTPLLQLQDLHAYYDKSHVLRGVNFLVQAGEIVSLLGRNGSGRSTTLKAIMSWVKARGSVQLRGREILGWPAFEIAQHGVGYVPENREIFAQLTTHQNLLMGEKPAQHSTATWSTADMYALFPQLQARQHTKAGVLSGGEQQMLTLCRTLMGNPDLLMIDEPAEGLAPHVIAQLVSCLLKLQKRGVTVLLVEQKLAIALQVSQRCYVMGQGQIVFEGTPSALRSELGVQKQWLAV
jgi:branched-chain amino acid transport system ATP-binding protein